MFKNCCNILELHCKVLNMSSKPSSYLISISCCSLVNSATPNSLCRNQTLRNCKRSLLLPLKILQSLAANLCYPHINVRNDIESDLNQTLNCFIDISYVFHLAVIFSMLTGGPKLPGFFLFDL